MRRPDLAILCCLTCLPVLAQAPPGSEAVGNTDGTLTWSLGDLPPGGARRCVVLFAWDKSYAELLPRLDAARRWAAALPASAAPAGAGEPPAWIGNDVTDFALDPQGTFFWEGSRQALRCAAGGQLSRLGYALSYGAGGPQRAGTSVTRQDGLQNLRVAAPVRAAGPREMLGTLATADGRLTLRLRAMVGDGPVAALEYEVANTGPQPVTDLRLTVYANLEAAHSHEGDYCQLDTRSGGLLTVDPPSGLAVVMAGLDAPASGYAGTWPSEAALQSGGGVPRAQWGSFTGVGQELSAKLSAALNVPHEINRAALPEPPTRALTAAEAAEALRRDWLFQADGQPTLRRARQEIGWARQLAARLASHAKAPDLSAELRELDALAQRCAGASAAPAGKRTIPPGAVGYWACDEVDGDALDDSAPGGHAGKLSGEFDRVPGAIGGGLALAGGYAELGRTAAAVARGSYTFTAWLRTTSSEADIIGNGVGAGRVLFMAYRGVLRGHHWTNASGNVLDGTVLVNDGRWHHVAEVVDERSLTLYVDGRPDASAPFQGERTAADEPLLLGVRAAPAAGSYTSGLFTGQLDEVGVFGRALTAAELAAMAAEGRAQEPRADPQAAELYLQVRAVKRRIALKNPVLDFERVLCIDQPYPSGSEWPHEARHRDGILAVPGGRLLVLDGLGPDAKVRKLAPGDTAAAFWRPDLSFDGSKVLFCMKPADEKSFHLYEIGVDGAGLRQITRSDYDDLDPIYLPDGHLMFSTTRANTYVRCMPYTYCYVLARSDADGRNIYAISQGNEPDWLPTLLNDGRVIYTRWEYTDKMLWRVQSLWTINPDGTQQSTYWGNQSVWPDMLVEPRPIPGSERVMFVGAAHHDWFAGSVGILDARRGRDFPLGLTKVTAEVPWPECGAPPTDPIECADYHRAGAFTAYKTPYPLSEDDFLVSARDGAVPSGNGAGKYKLYLMDRWGNRELLYEGGYNILHAMPIRPRPVPPLIADRVAWPGTGDEHRHTQPGTLYSGDVCQGVPDLRGKVKFLRVIQMDSRTASTWTRDREPNLFSGPVVSLLQADGVKRILGTVPVAADGSCSFEVPAGKALHFQLLDEHERALQTMRSFVGVMPGERRGCVGCHESHSTSPVNQSGTALGERPRKLTPPPWGNTTLGYERSVQPVLERSCGSCHSGDGDGRQAFDVTLRPGQGIFKEPYVTLVGGDAYQAAKTDAARRNLAGCLPVETWPQAGEPAAVKTFPPLRYMSFTSPLVNTYAASGDHHGVRMPADDLRVLAAWVDLTCPYRGAEEIREIPDPDFPGIEILPIRPRVRTAPEIDRFDLPQDKR